MCEASIPDIDAGATFTDDSRFNAVFLSTSIAKNDNKDGSLGNCTLTFYVLSDYA